MKYPHYHDEVLEALQAIGRPSFGLHMAKDRRSNMLYVGIRVPALRHRVREGFSFYALDPVEVLDVWDDLWMHSEWGDVLFAAEEYYRPIVRRRIMPQMWPVMRRWIERVDNWAHADSLSWTYSRLLEADPESVLPVLRRWNASEDLWPKRISIVSLIHYTGKNAVFLPAEAMLPMLDNCIEDRRYYMQKAVGWVLREMWRAYPDEVNEYVHSVLPRIAPAALTRAMERQPKEERARLRALREASV
ncbi:MAG: DNA alkylation repair protein [Gammaproteobacteria bacterium]|nr:DNA alkylation repair protein [Gammaproteobacteria bacterium]